MKWTRRHFGSCLWSARCYAFGRRSIIEHSGMDIKHWDNIVPLPRHEARRWVRWLLALLREADKLAAQ
jgi:hypothetical protein